MVILVTGIAGFIGSRVAQLLAQRGDTVIGVDNINDYYDVNLKYARLSHLLGIKIEGIERKIYCSSIYSNLKFIKLSIDE